MHYNYDPVLQDANRQFQKYKEEGGDADRPQKWGDSVALPNNSGVNLDVIQPYQLFVDIGPFGCARPVYLDTDVLPRIQPGSAFFTNRPTYSYRLVMGIGHAALTEDTDVMPSTVFCTSLQVYARRLVEATGGAIDSFRKAIWASIDGETPSSPQCFGYENFTMGIGTAVATMNPPWWCTHMMATTAAGENSQRLACQVVSPINNFAGVTATGTFFFTWSSTASAPGPINQPVPIPRNMISYTFRREVTTAANNYTVWYCR